jgi:hypothetical protein
MMMETYNELHKTEEGRAQLRRNNLAVLPQLAEAADAIHEAVERGLGRVKPDPGSPLLVEAPPGSHPYRTAPTMLPPPPTRWQALWLRARGWFRRPA